MVPALPQNPNILKMPNNISFESYSCQTEAMKIKRRAFFFFVGYLVTLPDIISAKLLKTLQRVVSSFVL